MRSVNSVADRALRVATLVAACLAAGAAFAGGPLYLANVGGTMKPLHWSGTVQVYLDQGNLNVGSECVRNPDTYECELDEAGNPVYPVLDQQAGDQLVAATVAQWSGVVTSSFRATVAGRAPVDINGANFTDYIGKDNGGGIQTIYDADNSVIMALTGGYGYGVLGIASPEIVSAQDPTRIIEGWQIIGGSFLNATSTEQVSGVVTHEFGHAINLAHSQTNGFYARNRGNPDWGQADGPEQAGPDQCGKVTGYPTAAQIETMYPMINPYPDSPSYNSPEMAKVDNADDIAALSSLYPAANYASTTGTLAGVLVAKDGTSQITGVNVIARRLGQPLDGAISRITGDATQGELGPDGRFVMTGLVPGASYLVYIDQIANGGFSTPKAALLGPEEYWDAAESVDATVDDACASTPVTVGAGQTVQVKIAMNGIARAPTFVNVGYGYVGSGSDSGQKITGAYGLQGSPFFLWDKQTGSKEIGGSGYTSRVSGNGRVVGGSVAVPVVAPWGGEELQERAALWTREAGWKSIAPQYEGCGTFQSNVYDLSTDGSTAVGLAWVDCSNVYAFKWNAKTGMKLLSKVSENAQCQDPYTGDAYPCEGSASANAMSSSGGLIGGWEAIPEAGGLRIGSIWRGSEQELMRDPAGDNPAGGWAGEVMGVNSAGTIAVGFKIGPDLKDAYMWTPSSGVTSLGRYPGQACYTDWWTGENVCEDLETVAYSVSDDGKVITGAARLFGANIDDATLYTPRMGWMRMAEFLQRQGVVEASRWTIMGAQVTANGKVLVGTAAPLAADYVHAFRLELDQVYVCTGKGRDARTLRVGFPDAMDQFLAKGATVGLCPGDAPL